MKKALFLDRDGIINIDHGYVYKVSQFEFVAGIFDLCKAAQVKGYEIFIVTNQSGIARGYYNIEDFETLTSWMLSKFAEHDVHIKQVYFCPHHPSKGVNSYKKECSCRKPAPGMIIQAQSEHNIDVINSVLVGDKLSDIEAAQKANIGTRILYNEDKTISSKLITHQIGFLKDIIPLLAP